MYSAPPTGWPDPFVLHPHGRNGSGDAIIANGGVSNTASIGAVNRALFFLCQITESHTYVSAFVGNGATVSGNFDLGIYSMAGVRLGSTGSTAQAGASVTQKVTLATPVTLGPGSYYLAIAADGTTGVFMRANLQTPSARVILAQMMSTAFPLPANATFITMAGAVVPIFGFTELSWL